MQKYRPVTVFIGVHQYDAVRVLAEATRNPAKQCDDESVSSLVRLAVTRLLQDVEEWDDALKFNATHEDMHMVNGRSKPITEGRLKKFSKLQ